MHKEDVDKKTDSHDLSVKQVRLNFVVGDVSSFDPHDLHTGGREGALGKWLFEGLTRLNPQGEYELAGAADMNVSACQTRYTFTVRPSHYSNGELVSAYDYEQCWKRAIAPGSKCANAHLFYCIKNAEAAKKGDMPIDSVGVKAVDKTTLIVDLEQPTSYFLKLLSSHLFAPFKIEKGQILFGGPYRVEERKEDDYLLLGKNPYFWDHSQVAIEKIKIFMVCDPIVALSLYEEGDIDWIGDPFSYLPSEVLSTELSKGNLFQGPEIVFPYWVYLNTETFPLSSPLIRKALYYTVNQKEIADYLFIGDKPLFSPFPFSTHEDIAESYDLEKGREFFEQGLKDLGLTKDTFPALKLTSSSTTIHKRLAQCLQETWHHAFGITVDLEVQDWNTFFANMSKGAYQIGGFFTSINYNDPVACLEVLSNENNFSKWHCAQYQKIVDKLKCVDNIQVRESLLKEAEAILKQEFPIIWVVNRIPYHRYPSNLKGLCFDSSGIPDFRWAYFD